MLMLMQSMAKHELVNSLDAVSQLNGNAETCGDFAKIGIVTVLSLIHISEPTRRM